MVGGKPQAQAQAGDSERGLDWTTVVAHDSKKRWIPVEE